MLSYGIVLEIQLSGFIPFHKQSLRFKYFKSYSYLQGFSVQGRLHGSAISSTSHTTARSLGSW